MITDLLREQIQQKHLIKSENLLDSIDFQVSKYGIDPVLLINFFVYGRFIEINWFKRSQNSRKMAAPNMNRMLWSMRENRKRTQKKDTRWYAKTAYGTINHLIAVLSNDFSDAERDKLKQILTDRYESKN
jgi:hypothetical protein